MILIDFFETLAFAGVCALIAVVYRHILLAEPVLNWWARFGAKFENKWWHAPIWGCHMCISGQLALWLYLYWKLNLNYSYFKQGCSNLINENIYLINSNGWTLTGHLFAICAAILLSKILKDKLEKWI